MPRDRVEASAACKLALDIGDQRLGRRLGRDEACALTEQRRIDGQEPPRLLIGGSPHHHAIDAAKVRGRLLEARYAAIEHDTKVGMRGFEPIDAGIIEWGDVAVLSRRQTIEPRLARVYDQSGNAGALNRAGEGFERLLRVLIVDADAALDRHGQLDRSNHGCDAVADESRLCHQTRAEAAFLHAVGGTADVEIDLVVAELLGDARAFGKSPRIAAAKLECNRM